MPPRRQPPHGFTLVELLTVIAIISVLLALLLPAVQAAREAARKSQCSNQLRQIGFGMLNYESQNGHLPPGARLRESQFRQGHGWRVDLLPFVEEEALHTALLRDPDATTQRPEGDYDKTFGVDAPAVWFCPSAEPVVTNEGLPSANYAGVAGADLADPGSLDLPEQDFYGDVYTDGVLFPASRVRLAEVTDGTSHTLAIGERLYEVRLRDWMFGTVWVGSDRDDIDEIQVGPCKNVRWPLNADNDEFGYYRWDPAAPAGADKTMLENDLPFGSAHPGGAFFVLVDGSVHFLPDDIDFTVYQELATKCGGEVNRWEP